VSVEIISKNVPEPGASRSHHASNEHRDELKKGQVSKLESENYFLLRITLSNSESESAVSDETDT